jgi:replicative DNA helicase
LTSLFDNAPDTEPSPGDPLERMPPQDLPAEQSILGAMMMSADAIDDVTEVITNVRDYYRLAHRLIHQAIIDLSLNDEPADPHTVTARLRERGQLDQAGGASYLHTCIAANPSPASAGYHAEIVRDLAILRRLTVAGARIEAMGYAAQDTAQLVLDNAQRELHQVADDRASTDWAAVGDITQATIDGIEERSRLKGKLVGISTGFDDLDALTRGWRGGQFIVVAARPAVGKSTFGSDALRACAIKSNLPCVVFSLEMGRHEITERLLSADGQIAHHHIRSGDMTDDDWERMAKASERVRKAPLFIDDSPNLSVMEIRTKARKLKQKHGIRLVVVDYLQLMKAGTGQKMENRQVEVAEISRQLKLLAKELDVPVIALSQLNRGPEQRTDKKPTMSDVRESGAIENDADIMILLHREDYYEKESNRAGEADFIIAKHRGGPTATITVAFQGHYSRFVDMAPDSRAA